MEINEGDLELLDYYAEVFEDDLGSFGELMTVLTEQASEAEDNLSRIQNGINELNAAYQAGEINQAQYQ
jgi:archaellum component FlaC